MSEQKKNFFFSRKKKRKEKKKEEKILQKSDNKSRVYKIVILPFFPKIKSLKHDNLLLLLFFLMFN